MPNNRRYCPRCGAETSDAVCPVDGVATVLQTSGDEAPALFRVGDLIGGRYRVERALGRGGFGAVYAARHIGTGQAVAVKVLLLQDPEGDAAMARRFFREAELTAALRHPNTVRVFDFGQADNGALYLAMELLIGPTLEEVCKRLSAQGKVMTAAQAIGVALPVLRSLGEAHRAGLVHRDLKPANILLADAGDDDPIVKVLDFGIARTQDSSLTHGRIVGTPQYMSPEQCQGYAVDGRSDLYALGVILYRCLCGQLPFADANPMTVLYKHTHEPPRDLAEVTPHSLPEGLVQLVMQLLAKQPSDRPADARCVRETLERLATEVATAPSLVPPEEELADTRIAAEEDAETLVPVRVAQHDSQDLAVPAGSSALAALVAGWTPPEAKASELRGNVGTASGEAAGRGAKVRATQAYGELAAPAAARHTATPATAALPKPVKSRMIWPAVAAASLALAAAGLWGWARAPAADSHPAAAEAAASQPPAALPSPAKDPVATAAPTPIPAVVAEPRAVAVPAAASATAAPIAAAPAVSAPAPVPVKRHKPAKSSEFHAPR